MNHVVSEVVKQTLSADPNTISATEQFKSSLGAVPIPNTTQGKARTQSLSSNLALKLPLSSCGTSLPYHLLEGDRR